jgi:mannose-6-phosphate isomerase-like protein (cupin superfamily)
MTEYRTQLDNTVAHNEESAFPALTVIDLKNAAASVDQTYKNFVVVDVNQHCVRMAVMQGEFRWHHHPNSDECFLVLEGELEIDLADGQSFRLTPGQAFTIPTGVTHRTRARTRAVNLCFEHRDAYTDVVFDDVPLGREQ